MNLNIIHCLRTLKHLPSRIRELENATATLNNKTATLNNKIAKLEEKLQKERNNNDLLRSRIGYLERHTRYISNRLFDNTQYPIALASLYLERTGNTLDLNNPQTYNEKIQWFKLFGITPEITRLADKYLVRAYVEAKIGKEYLVPLLGVWDYPEEIDFNKLPAQFVLKANHGCGYNYIVTDKEQMNISDAIQSLSRWLLEDFSSTSFEMQYRDIPRRVIAEKYLANQDPYEYKIWCFNGKAEYIRVMTDSDHKHLGDFYDRNWNMMAFNCNFPNLEERAPKPNNLSEILRVSEKLAAGFPHVRVDLYRMADGKLYFSEMTFTSGSGFNKWDSRETDAMLGRLFTYPGI